MSLTLGSIAPFGRPTGGALNIEVPSSPAHLLYLHALPQRVRGVHAGVTIVDTTHARLLHETRLLPRFYLPRDDIRTELLEPSDTTTHCPFKGDARYWHLRVGPTVVEDAFWEYPEPIPGAPPLAGLLSPYLEKFDRWLEEDEPVLGHPRDPFHRVDARRSTRTVVVRAGGTEIARSTRPVAVDETGLPTRWYIPLDDVDRSVLHPSDTSTVCPYKGEARYWAVEADGAHFEDAAWAYEHPLPEAQPAAHCICFSEALTIDVS